jgi:hypothetical protein
MKPNKPRLVHFHEYGLKGTFTAYCLANELAFLAMQ